MSCMKRRRRGVLAESRREYIMIKKEEEKKNDDNGKRRGVDHVGRDGGRREKYKEDEGEVVQDEGKE